MKVESLTPAILRLMSPEDRKHYDQTHAYCSGPSAIMERNPGNEPLEADQAKAASASRLHIRFTSARKRLCDPDNLSVKWLLDCLRYCGAIDGDEPDKITLEVAQRKCGKDEQEHTLIEVIFP